MTEPTRFPLCWPDTIPRRNGNREAGQFKTTLAAALKNVEDALRRFGADSGRPCKEIVISSNVTLGHTNPIDPGVAVWFKWEEQSICIPVDRYSKVEANLQAIFHVLEARRTEMRHGTLALVRATMKGFLALPSNRKPWREVFGIDSHARVSTEMVETRWKVLAQEMHPDKPGGSEDKMAALNVARSEALKEITTAG